MSRTAADSALSLLFVVVQTTIVRFLAIGTVVPDITLLWIVVLAIRRGPIAGSSAGFGIGLALDLLAGPDGMLGLSALSKTLAGFIAGYFYNENKTAQTLGGLRFLTVVGVVGLIHAVVYFVIFLQGSGLPWWQAVLSHGLPYALYTTAAALIPMFVFSRKVPA
jgi:rod shape-determining protein MreD